MKPSCLIPLAAAGLCLTACQSWLINTADRRVYRVIDNRQRAALGATHDSRLGKYTGDVPLTSRTYSFNPTPLDYAVPEGFQTAVQPLEPSPDVDPHVAAPPNGDAPPASAHPADETPPDAPPPDQNPPDDGAPDRPQPEPPLSDDPPPVGDRTPADRENGEAALPPQKRIARSIFTQEQRDHVTTMNLPDALAYAMRHGRDLLDAKEELYLSALDLTLERHLWTPQFVASVRTDFTNFPDDEALRRALNTAGELSVTQRLPYGGDVTARVLHRLMRDVTDRVEKGESGQVILEAQLPLLRGAGSVAYESRYQAERNLIYAVRDYERFRRTYLVGIAADYFNLQQLRANIDNTYKSYIDRADDLEKAEFIQQMGRSRNVRDAPRARSNLRSAEADLVSAKERYATTLDRFKVRIGMPVVALLDVIDQDEDKWSRTVDDLLPDVSVKLAVDVAVRQRLDLLNSADRLDDRRRGVVIAKNRVLPDLDLSGSLTMDSNPDQLRATNLRTERATWQGGIEFRLDDRRTERNAYRASLISLRRAERDYEESTDLVRADVRQALRRVFQQQNLRQIQAFNVKENNDRLLGARAQFNLGKADNQDVIDAANELLRAENDLARALASYRVSILEFRRDTGTLRITDDGRWAMGPEDANPAGIDRGAGDNAG